MCTLDSREYKTLLVASEFAADREDAMNKFWAHVKEKATQNGIGVQEKKNIKRRWVWFKDTENEDIRGTFNMSFRERRKLSKKGNASENKKVSLKSRADAKKAACDEAALRPTRGKKREFVCEQDVILAVSENQTAANLKRKFAGLGKAQFKYANEFTQLKEISAIFPALGHLQNQDQTISIVNEGFVAHEYNCDRGLLGLTPDCTAEASFTIWYQGTRDPNDKFGTGLPLVAEFSYKYETKGVCSSDEINEKASALLQSLAMWIESGGCTKTDIAYGDCL